MDKFIDKFKPFLINESDSKELYALQTKILNSHSEESLKIMQLALLQCEFPFENYERAIEILRLDAGESKDIRTGIIGFEMSFLFSDVDNAFRDNIKRLYAESSGYYQSLAEYLFALEYGSAKPVPAWVKNKAWIVHSISGERAVIDKSDDGKNSICSPIHVKYLSAIKQSGRVNDSYALAPYTVKVTASALNIREGAGTDYPIVSCIWDKGIYTVVEEKAGTGASKWGRLKSGAGWIALDYTVKQQHR